MSSNLRDRVLAAAAADAAPTRSVQRRRVVLLAASFLAVIGVMAISGHRGERSPRYLELVLAGHAVALSLATWWVVSPKRALGRSRPHVLASAALAVLALVAGALIASYTTAQGWVAPAPGMLTHVGCLAVELVMAGMFFFGALFGLRPFDPVAPRITAASFGVLGVAWGSLAITMHCPHSDPGHVLAAHVAPGLVFVVLGALVGERWVGVRRVATR